MAEKKYAVKESDLTAIADAIRLKRDITDEMTLESMPMQIGLIGGVPNTLHITKAHGGSNRISFDISEAPFSLDQIPVMFMVVPERIVTEADMTVGQVVYTVQRVGQTVPNVTVRTIKQGGYDYWGAGINITITDNILTIPTGSTSRTFADIDYYFMWFIN